MFLQSIIIITTTFFIEQTRCENPYCKLNCGKVKNTLCVHEPCSPSADCGHSFKMLPLSPSGRKEVMRAHNILRQKVALGLPTIPTASNMRALSYSKELEFSAQCLANNCLKGGSHDKCRKTQKFDYVGQNVNFLPVTEYNEHGNYTWRFMMDWFSEIAGMTDKMIQSYPNEWDEYELIGHVAQMLWANTYAIGCARTIFGKRGENKTLVFVCNYGPGGNAGGQPIYEIGEAATRCPPKAPADEAYKGLCGTETILDDKFLPPFVMGSAYRQFPAVTLLLITTFLQIIRIQAL